MGRLQKVGEERAVDHSVGTLGYGKQERRKYRKVGTSLGGGGGLKTGKYIGLKLGMFCLLICLKRGHF